MIDLKNTWCKATAPNHDKLRLLGFNHEPINWNVNYYVIDENYKIASIENKITSDTHKQIHLVGKEFQYVKEDKMEQDSFNKHGFETPEYFEGEILKNVENINMGWVRGLSGKPIQASWDSTGICSLQNYSGGKNTDSYNLTPINKPKPGEWCWFWDLGMMPPDISILKAISADGYFTTVTDRNYTNCEPFIGTLPTRLRN